MLARYSKLLNILGVSMVTGLFISSIYVSMYVFRLSSLILKLATSIFAGVVIGAFSEDIRETIITSLVAALIAFATIITSLSLPAILGIVSDIGLANLLILRAFRVGLVDNMIPLLIPLMVSSLSIQIVRA